MAPDQLNDRIQTLLTLRQRAEQRRHLVTQPAQGQSADELQRLVQELQVHQIELEMQNEELLLAQAEAQQAHAQYLDLYDFAPVGYLTLSPKGVIEQLNLCAARQLGTTRQRLQERRFGLFVEPADRPAFNDFVDRVLATDATQRQQLRLRTDDQHLLHVQLEALRVDSPAGPQCRLVVVDITEHHEAHAALAANEARFRSVFEHSPDGMLLIEGGQLVDGNATILRLFGLPDKSRLVGRPVGSFAPERQPDGTLSTVRMLAHLATARRRGWERFEWYWRDPAGQERWLEITAAPVAVGPQPLMQFAVRDITAQHAARQRMQASEARLSLALRAAGLGVWTLDSDPDLLAADAHTWALLGRAGQQGQLPFQEIVKQLVAADQPLLAQARQQALRSDQPVELEVRLHVPGSEHPRHLQVMGQLSAAEPGGPPARLTGLVRDITARRQAEEELGYKNRLLDHLLESLPIVLGQLSPEGHYLELVGQGLRRLGVQDNELRGQSIFDQFPALAEPTRRLLAGEPINFLGVSEVSGAPVYMQSYGFFDQQRQRAVVFAIDVTEMMQAREEATQLRLRQQQEVLMVSLETQESERRRIAESLHNGLGQLLYAAKLALSGPPSPAGAVRAQRLLDEAVRTTRTISYELTPGVLIDFGLLAALQELVKRLPHRPLAVRLHVQGLGTERLPEAVEIAAYRIAQELLNNVIKHAQATEATLRVALEAGPLPRLVLVMEDNGRGFEPAAVGVGGMGLRGIRNRVAVLGGQLAIGARPGQGTIITVELPVG